MTSRNALIYDFLLVAGGAEALSLHVADSFPSFDLVTGFTDEAAFPPGSLPVDRVHSLTSASRIPGWQGLKTMAAFDRHGQCLAEYETAVFSGVYAPVGVAHRDGRRNLYYCHTPPRFAYDLEAYYQASASAWQRPLLRRLARHVRRRYSESLAAMDRIAANSANVAGRLERYLGITDAVIIHPPVDTARYRWVDDDGYFLSTARLEPYKRVDRLVTAFIDMPQKKLVVASGGSEERRLRQMAEGAENIHFTGWQPPTALRELVGRCRATIYLPKDEDFGISPVESMAAGKLVIGVDEGGVRETVVDGQTGLLLEPGAINASGERSTQAIKDAVERITAERANEMRPACEHRAERFSQAAFDAAFARFISD